MVKILFGTKMNRRDFPAMMALEPSAIEFHTTDDDLNNHLEELKKISSNIKLPKIVHVPISIDGQPFSLKNHFHMIKKCVQLGEMIVIHPDISDGKNHNQILDEFIPSLSMLRDINIKVALENVPNFYEYEGKTAEYVICNNIDDFKKIFKIYPNYGMCFDVCHAAMIGENIEQWFRELGRYMIHLHFSDSKDGLEGLQIGEGVINWKDVFNWAEKYCSGRIVVIPEIIDGYKEGGAGFRTALQRLKMIKSS
jgi:sugar phosphate isomerase/epimerase